MSNSTANKGTAFYVQKSRGQLIPVDVTLEGDGITLSVFERNIHIGCVTAYEDLLLVCNELIKIPKTSLKPE